MNRCGGAENGQKRYRKRCLSVANSFLENLSVFISLILRGDYWIVNISIRVGPDVAARRKKNTDRSRRRNVQQIDATSDIFRWSRRDALERRAKKNDDKYPKVQSKSSIVRKETVPLGDKLRFGVLSRVLGSLTRIYALYWLGRPVKDSGEGAINWNRLTIDFFRN